MTMRKNSWDVDPDTLSPHEAAAYWTIEARVSADRMIKFLDLNAPTPILEAELALMAKRIARLDEARQRQPEGQA
jgi:hypothetical protein